MWLDYLLSYINTCFPLLLEGKPSNQYNCILRNNYVACPVLKAWYVNNASVTIIRLPSEPTLINIEQSNKQIRQLHCQMDRLSVLPSHVQALSYCWLQLFCFCLLLFVSILQVIYIKRKDRPGSAGLVSDCEMQIAGNYTSSRLVAECPNCIVKPIVAFCNSL
jgi:hypothetical protein